MSSKKSIYIIFTLIVILSATILPLFASSYPDGLESVAEKLNFAHLETVYLTFAPFADYQASFVSNVFVSQILIGITGITITGFVSYIIFSLLGKS